MKMINTVLAASALAIVASQASAAVYNVTGSITGALNSQATISYVPAAPTITGTFDDSNGAFSWAIQDHTMNINIVPGFGASIALTNGTLTGNGAGQVGGSSTVVSCTGGAAAMICPSVGTPPTSNTYTYTWNGANGTVTQLINGGVSAGGNTISYAFSGTPQEVPVPAAAWLFGSALVGLAGVARKRG